MLQSNFIFEPSLELRKAQEDGQINTAFSLDPSLKNIKMTLNEVTVKRKKELVGKAEVFLLTIVVDNCSANPIQVTCSEIFNNVRKGDKLTLGPAGLAVYRNEAGKIPAFLEYRIMVIESDKRVREFGATLTELNNDPRFKDFVKSILLLSSVSAGVIPVIASATVFALEWFAKALSLNQDDQMILIQGSYDDKFDDLGVVYKEVVAENSFIKLKYQVKAA